MSDFKRTLGPLLLWSLGVGYVISGMYFGWNLGLELGGPYGFFIATCLVTVFYILFVFNYSELACAYPRAGGAFVYVHRAFGPGLGFVAAAAQCIEFIFAPPAIAAAIGAYFAIFFPDISATQIAFIAYFIFTALNIYGVKQSALFEFVITIFAVFELLLFAGLTLPSFQWQNFSMDSLPTGWTGILSSIPFAIWFYLAIEGVANVAEETIHPQKNLSRGFISAMTTLVVLALLTFFSAVGVGGWRAVVYKPGSAVPSDSPLPLALAQVVSQDHFFYHLLILIGLCGLVASFHGIILVAGRATFELGRVGYAPRWVGKTLKTRQTPASALLVNMGLGFVALLTGRTSEIIILSVFGALVMYVLSLLSLIRLRKTEATHPRPFKTPFYPWSSYIALALGLLSLGAMTYYNLKLAILFATILGVGLLWFYMKIPKEIRSRQL